jgi:hypothetical protein
MKQTLRPSKNHEGSATRNVNPKDRATLFEPREGAATRKTTTVSKGVPPVHIRSQSRQFLVSADSPSAHQELNRRIFDQ